MSTTADWSRGQEIAWAAGLFEGEGSIVPSGKSIRLTLQMQDMMPVKRLHSIFPEANYREYIPPGGKRQYVWDLCGWEKVERVMQDLLPWLCVRRKNRWAELLRQRPPSKMYPPDCGETQPCSTAGAQRHYNRGEKPCRACVEARSEYSKLHGHWER
jgi:hypothetical protein